MPIKGVYIDTETGGLDERGNALLATGLASFIVENKVLTITDELYLPIRPPKKLTVSEEALEVQGLTWERYIELNVRNGIDEEKAFNEMRHFLFKNLDERPLGWKYKMWAWNADFDYRFVRAWSDRVAYTSKLFPYKRMFSDAMETWQQAYGMGLHTEPLASLDIACETLGIDNTKARENGHDAMIDARLGAFVLGKMIEKGYLNVGE